jgi:hypothetical protein
LIFKISLYFIFILKLFTYCVVVLVRSIMYRIIMDSLYFKHNSRTVYKKLTSRHVNFFSIFNLPNQPIFTKQLLFKLSIFLPKKKNNFWVHFSFSYKINFSKVSGQEDNIDLFHFHCRYRKKIIFWQYCDEVYNEGWNLSYVIN